MSIYLFSGDDDGIEALAGVKGVSIPAPRLAGALGLNSLLAGRLDSDADLARLYAEAIESEAVPVALAEETDHFRCLAQSRYAGLFHVRNVLLRWGFSTALSPVPMLALEGRAATRALAGVRAYYEDYAAFVWGATPWIEAHFHLHLGVGRNTDVGPLGRDERVRRAMETLVRRHVPMPAHSLIGLACDVAYTQPKLDLDATLEAAECLLTERRHVPFEWERDIASLLGALDSKGALRGMRAAIATYGPYVVRQSLARINPTAAMMPDALPSLITGTDEVDPLHFPTKRTIGPGHERGFAEHGSKVTNDLCWYVASRLTTTLALLKRGVSGPTLLNYLNTLCRFHATLRGETSIDVWPLEELNEEIVLTAMRQQAGGALPGTAEVVRVTREYDTLVRSYRNTPLGASVDQTIGRAYMHV